MVKRRFLCSLQCCSPCCVVLALVGANNRFVGAYAMFATFAPMILWFAHTIAAFAPMIAAFALGIFSKTHQSSLSINGGIFSKITPSLFTIKEGSTAFPKPLSPQGQGMCQPPYSVLKPLRYKVGGPSEVSPAAELHFAVCDRMDMRKRRGCR